MSTELENRLRVPLSALPGPDDELTARVEARLTRAQRPRRVRRRLAVATGVAGTIALTAVAAVLFVNLSPSSAPAAERHWQPGEVVVPDFVGQDQAGVIAMQAARYEEVAAECRRDPASCPGGRLRGVVQTRNAEVRASDRPAGTVLEQSPPAGERVAENTYARLVIAGLPGDPEARPLLPDLELAMLAGEPTRLSEWDGSVVMVLFVSSDCGACAGALQHVLEERDVHIHGESLVVVSGASAEAARSLTVRRVGGVVVDSDRSIARAFGVTEFPTWVGLDRKRRIATRFDGSATPATLDETVAVLRAESPPYLDPQRADPIGLSNIGEPIDPDEVPEFFRTVTVCEVDPARVWRIAGDATNGLYLAQGPRLRGAIGGYGPTAGEGGFGCAGPERHGTGPVTFGSTPSIGMRTSNEDGSIRFASGIVPDGWTQAEVVGRTIPIPTNGIIIEGPLPKGTVVRFTGPAGVKEIRLG